VKKLDKDMMIGEVIDLIPESGELIQRYFHGGCYHCPAMKMETLEMGAMLHGHDVNAIIAELEKLPQKE